MCDIVNSTPSRPLQAGVMKMTCVSLTLSMTSMLLFTPRPRVFQLCLPTCMVRSFPLLCKIPWLSLIVSLFLSPSFVRNLILQNIVSFTVYLVCHVLYRGTDLSPSLLQKFRQFSLDTGYPPPKNGTAHLYNPFVKYVYVAQYFLIEVWNVSDIVINLISLFLQMSVLLWNFIHVFYFLNVLPWSVCMALLLGR